jgi:hypothetical protein
MVLVLIQNSDVKVICLNEVKVLIRRIVDESSKNRSEGT